MVCLPISPLRQNATSFPALFPAPFPALVWPVSRAAAVGPEQAPELIQRLKEKGQLVEVAVGSARRLLLHAVAAKPTGHHLERGVSTEVRNMYQLGG